MTADDLVDMHFLEDDGLARIELAYAQADNLLFGEAIYRPDAKLWLEKRLAAIVQKAALTLHEYGLRPVLYDGLRTVDAQAKMLETARVKENPQWLEEPRLLSPPGAGAHPRGMAIDISLETLNGELLDMGTPFDFLASDPSPEHNPAHREYQGLSDDVIKNRNTLNNALLGASEALFNKGKVNAKIEGLPQEWWDFRFPAETYNAYAALSDEDLPPDMCMT